MHLLSQSDLEKRFPRGWAYLASWEKELRKRESSAFDDDEWWRLGRNQNLDKQSQQKLIVAQTVPEMRVCFDTKGDKHLNNVRVNGILPAKGIDPYFLEGVLNGAVANFVFKRIGKPKDGGYFEANKQFIAPLPIPKAGANETAAVARAARGLQESWTRRRELLEAAAERLAMLARAEHDERWLWPAIPGHDALVAQAPAVLTAAKDRKAWAEQRAETLVADRTALLQGALDAGQALEADFADGELRFFAQGAPLAENIYLDDADGRLAASYWRWLILSRAWKDASSLAADLRRPPVGAETPAARQFVERVAALEKLTAEIRDAEAGLNVQLYRLYGLTPDEIALVEQG